MRSRLFYISSAIFFCTWITSCGGSSGMDTSINEKKSGKNKNLQTVKTDPGKNNSPEKKTEEDTILTTFDAKSFVTDTTLYLNNYHIIIGKEKFDVAQKEYSNDDLEFNSTIIYFILKDNDSVVAKKEFKENWFSRIKSFDNGPATYFTLVSSGGGSGYIANIYKIEFEPAPTFIEVASYNELSSTQFSNDGSELLIMNGIWDMSDEADEAHFSDHKYEISLVNLHHKKFERTAIGTTHDKYPSADVDFTSAMLLKQIHQQEPGILKGINLDKYSF